MRRMVLGGGSNQLELLKKSKERGDFIVLIDYLSDCPGKKYADVHLQISTFDKDKVINACIEYNIDSVVTVGTDQPVYTAACASNYTTDPFYLNEEVALSVTHKKVMKELFTKHNIPTVKYRFIKDDFDVLELEEMRFPLVLKPVDCQGQRGIYKCMTIEDVKNRVADTISFSREDYALIEEYYENDEITVNGWVTDGELTILSVVDRVTIRRNEHIGIALCHNHPSLHLDNYAKEIDVLTENVVDAFNIKNGPIYFQYFVGTNGLLVNEIACRVGGAYEGITIPYLTGVDIIEKVLDYPKQSKTEFEKFAYMNSQVYLSTQLFFLNPGILKEVSNIDEFKDDEKLLDIYFEYKKGDIIPKLENATARAGYFIVKGTTFSNMIDNVNSIFDSLDFYDDENLIIKYSDYKDKYYYV